MPESALRGDRTAEADPNDEGRCVNIERWNTERQRASVGVKSMVREFEPVKYSVGGIAISATNMRDFVSTVRLWLEQRRAGQRGAFVCFRDAHGIVRSRDDERVLLAHRSAFMVVPDGKPVAMVGRLRGFRHVGQVRGIDALEVLCRAGVEAGWKHYLYGAGPGVAERLRAAMEKKIPGIRIVGTEMPPYRPESAEEGARVRERILESGADILWVGLSSPKQEIWMAANAPMLGGVMAMGVGAAFDVHAGLVTAPPRPVRALGLEWAYRVVKEPGRLWWRYAEVVPRFLLLLAREAMEPKKGG